ncbi:MAG: hypothetical protein ABI068_01035 [Ktedonobacterales bacterium]
MSEQPPYKYVPQYSPQPDDQEPLYPPPGSQAHYAQSQPLGLSPVSSQSLTQPGQTTEQAPLTPYGPYVQQTPPAPYDPYAQYGPQLNAPTYLAPPSYQAPYPQPPHYPASSHPLYPPQQPIYQQPMIAQPMVIAPVIMPFTIARPPSIPGAGAALNSMVLGIIGLIAAVLSVIPLLGLCTYPISFILATIGVITGLVGLRSTTNRRQAITGLILSGIALAILGLIILVVIANAGHH